MKNCKKIALLVIIFMLSTVLNVYAAGTAEITLTPSATEVKVGDTVTITLAAKCETGIEGIDSILEYDKTKLSLTDEAAADGFTSMSGEDLASGEYKVSVLYTDTTDAPTEASFVTLTFEVLDTVTVDEVLSVKLSGIEVGDSDDEWMTVEDKQVTLTVIDEQEQNPDDGEQTPGDEEQNPEDGEQTPGDEEQNPEDGEQIPGDEEQNPEDGEQTPGDEEQNPGNEEQAPDNTIADKPINNAGLANFASIAVVGIVVVAIVLYAKCRKYKDVK